MSLSAIAPDHISIDQWREACTDARAFVASWGAQADAFGWSTDDIFGLAPLPAWAHPSFRRNSRYDKLGLAWLIRGRKVVAITENTAAIKAQTGSLTTFYKR